MRYHPLCGLNLFLRLASNRFYFFMIVTRIFYFIFFILFSLPSFCQNSITGFVADQSTGMPLASVNVSLIPADSGRTRSTSTNATGRFELKHIKPGTYTLKIQSLGYKIHQAKLSVDKKETALGTVKLEPDATELKGVKVEGAPIRSQQKGDTAQYNAHAYKVNKDASTEDLVTKMPGITMENGVVKAQGEQVQKVLIDGKEFFGDDASIALKNLPAEVVDKIQVFDRMSDQARFSGFDDGNTQKTINVVTRRDKNEGRFGKVYAGYGTDNRFYAGINMNLFNGDRRITLLGLSNNINQQNFSMQDLTGMMGSGGGGRGMGGGGFGGRGMMGGGMPQGMTNYMMQNSGMGNFMVGQQNGIATTHAAGLNYIDTWGTKIKVNGNYFFNLTGNESILTLKRSYFNTKPDSALIYNENSISNTNNANHRASLRIEYNPDTANAFIFTPSLSYQEYSSTTYTFGNNSMAGKNLSGTDNRNNSKSTAYTVGGNLMYRHRFLRAGRTFSANTGINLNNKEGEGALRSTSNYFSAVIDTGLTDQQNDNYTRTTRYEAGLNYNEPIGRRGQLQFSYNPSFSINQADKQTKNFNSSNSEYTLLDTALSNKYTNTYLVNKGGIGYTFNDSNRFTLSVNVNYQVSRLEGEQQFPTAYKTDRSFQNVLPTLMLNYKFSSQRNIRMYYRTSANAPSVSQLQNVINNSNPVMLSTGNPNLDQDFTQMIVTRYSSANIDKGRSFFAVLFASFTQNYIGNQTLIPGTTDTLSDGTILKRGTQLTRPVNLDGYMALRSFFTYGFPVKFLKSNLNLNVGATYNKTPGLINNAENVAHAWNISEGFVLSSNISEKIDFTLSYTGNINLVRNTLQSSGTNNNYFYQLSSVKFNWQFWKGMFVNTQNSHTLYTGLNQGFNIDFLLCNAAVGYKFLPSQALEVKLSVYDLFNQNNNVSRTVTETYVEDNVSNILRQYFMLTLTYNVRQFKSKRGT